MSSEQIRQIIHDLLYNLFTLHLREIHKVNLPTLRIREPRVYKTIEDRKIRETLVKSGFFKVDLNTPRPHENLEIVFNDSNGQDRLLYELTDIANLVVSGEEKLVQGKKGC
ncbi:MAG: hypothetical protein ACTSRV_15045 [Candidatus Freyarchaeota archaeon]